MLELHEIRFFSELSPEDLEAVRGRLDLRSFPAGSFICRKGDAGRHFYAIAEGGVDVLVTGRGAAVERVFLGPGRVFGEMSLISDEPVSASVRAVRDTQVYALSKENFLHLLQTRPRLYEPLVKMLVERVRHRFMHLSLPPCALIVYHGGDTRVEELARRVFRVIRHYSPESVFVDSHQRPVDDPLPSPSLPDFFPATSTPVQTMEPGHFAVQDAPGWFVELIKEWREKGSRDRYLVLAVTPDVLSRLESTLAPADAVVLLHDRAGESGAAIPADQVDTAHVGIRDADGDTRGNGHWHYQVPEEELRGGDTPAQGSIIDRIGRWVTRREIGLALGSGAARGFAHLGVLQVLHEAGIPLDYVAGSSIGGIVAVVYGHLADPHEATAQLQEHIGANRKVRDLSWLPRSSLLSGRKVRQASYAVLGQATFADLQKPASVVAADLMGGQRVIIDHGLLAEAALATSAIPGFFPPVELDGRMLGDGGLLCRVPLDLLSRRRCGLRIAVNVTPPRERQPLQVQGDDARVDTEFNRLLGFTRVLTTSWEIIAKGHAAAECEGADIVLEPCTKDYAGFDFDAMEGMVAAGRKEAEAKLDILQEAVARVLRPGNP
ncbi:MAG: patatin-like phospholipase family protein [Planctomycetota bacterium]